MVTAGPPLTIFDLSPFFCATGGGIRTYHEARIEWFRRQPHHRYVLVCPGPRYRVSAIGSNATLVRVFGPPVTRDADGYRVMLDFRAVQALVTNVRPDVIEAGDPWISGPFGLLLRRRGLFDGLLSSFYHSDPIATHVPPWLAGMAGSIFYRIQACYDVTLAASRTMKRRLQDRGVANVVQVPFGVDPLFFDIPPRRARRQRPIALLYAGRLDTDKEIGLLIDILPRVLRRSDVTVTVVGKGKYRDHFARVSHSRFTYLEYVSDRTALGRVYEASDILLAPGRYETFGLAALEAAAAGLVVVGPDAGGTGELLGQLPSPFMFEPGNAAAFFEKIVEAVECDLAPMSDQSRALAAAYGAWPDAIGRHLALYESLTQKRRCCH